MTVRQILEHVDRVKPNGFAPEDKLIWLNELEYDIQTGVFGQTGDFETHVWTDLRTGAGLVFAGDTLTVPGTLEARPGGTVTITDLDSLTDNQGTFSVMAVRRTDTETVLTLPAGAVVTEGTASGTVTYDGGGEEPLLHRPWHKLYYAYLEARIESANGEWTEYDNAMALYNGFLGEYQRWYARNNVDNPEVRGTQDRAAGRVVIIRDDTPGGGGSGGQTIPTYQQKTVTPSLSGDIIVTPDAGYDGLSQVTVQRAGAWSGDGPMTYSYDAQNRQLTISAAPTEEGS